MNFGITFSKDYEGIKSVDGLDYASIKATAQEIFNRAKSNSVLSESDLSKFTRAEKGLDLYNGKIGTDVAREISLLNSGKTVQLDKAVQAQIQYLNTQAAKIAAQSSARNVDGKIPVNPSDTVLKAKRENAPLSDTTDFLNIDSLSKDGNSDGNPFRAKPKNNSSSEN